MCLLEGTNLSEGRGTDAPFLTVGAPYIDPRKWLDAIPADMLAGIRAEPVTFRPRAIPGVVSQPKYRGEACRGLRLTVTDRERFQPIPLAVAMLCAARQLWPERFTMSKYLDKLWGNEVLRGMVSEGYGPGEILATCAEAIARFESVRDKYLRYQ